MSATSGPVTVRVRGLPLDSSRAVATISQILQSSGEEQPQYSISILPSCQRQDQSAALVDFPKGLPVCLSALQRDPQATHTVTVEDKDILFDVHFAGFTQLSVPSAPINADIVAICGIDGHAYRSWQTETTPSRRMWLRHFLPKDIPASCRFLTYGYSTSLGRNDSTTIGDFSVEFLDALKEIRIGETKTRPIVLVAYDSGCLILAQALIEAAQVNNEHDEDLKHIHNALAGILFYAIPQRGLDVDDTSRITGTVNDSGHGLYASIAMNSEALQILSDDFKKVLHGQRVISFFATEKHQDSQSSDTGDSSRTEEHFTSSFQDKAILTLPSQTEIRIPLQKDRSSIAKFDSIHDVGYKHTIHHIKRFLSSAHTTKKADSSPAQVTQQKPEPRNNIAAFEMPFARDATFVQRPELMELLKQKCLQPASRTALWGLGGVGKSQLAIECAYQLRNEVPDVMVFWIHASNSERFRQDINDLADHLGLSTQTASDGLESFRQWLSTHKSWLLILDNVDDNEFLYKSTDDQSNDTFEDPDTSRSLMYYLPRSQNGSILFTTRNLQVAENLVEIANIIKVDEMSEPEAVRLFEQKVYQAAQGERQSVELIRELECMPLAIIQAAAYITQRSCSVGDFLNVFRKDNRNITSIATHEADKQIGDWDSISFDSIRKKHEQAGHLLSIFCLLDRQGIPEELIRQTLDVIRNQNDETNIGDAEFDDAVLVLRKYSMASLKHSTRSFHLHRLVQLATLRQLSAEGSLDEWQGIVIKGLRMAFPKKDFRWADCQRLYPHFNALQTLQSIRPVELDEWSKLLLKVSFWRWYINDHDTALKLSSENLAIQRDRAETDKFSLVDALISRAQVITTAEREDEALELLEEARQVGIDIISPTHSTNAQIMSQMGTAYRLSGRYEEAKDFARRALDLYSQIYGATDSIVTLMEDNLANVLACQQRWDEAETIQRGVLSRLLDEFGVDHCDVAISRICLSSTCEKLGKMEDAIQLLSTNLQISEHTSGKDQPNTIRARQNLADAYRRCRSWKNAKELDEIQLQVKRRVYGMNDLRTVDTIFELGRDYGYLDRYDEAIPLMHEALDRYTAILGPDSVYTKTCIGNVDALRKNREKYEQEILTKSGDGACNSSKDAAASMEENPATQMGTLHLVAQKNGTENTPQESVPSESG